ncbi:MAG TPA: GNAT family N-acetyltransferase [Gemmatimonadaceae bacterium]|nr:GNAT family N-acetyltransferase [Gemmatimonadaceae bacterium]
MTVEGTNDPVDAAVRIRRASAADAAALAALAEWTFRDTYAAYNTAADMEAHVSAHFTVPVIEQELRDARCTYLVAEGDGAFRGFAQLVDGTTPACVRGPAPLEVGRFYVDRPWHGTGLAARLMDACVAEACARGASSLWLGVWERNPRAIRFYEKFGFADVGVQDFHLGADVQADRVLERML